MTNSAEIATFIASRHFLYHRCNFSCYDAAGTRNLCRLETVSKMEEQARNSFSTQLSISYGKLVIRRFQRPSYHSNSGLGRCPRLSHSAPVALSDASQ
jgi:hypothetical protein